MPVKGVVDSRARLPYHPDALAFLPSLYSERIARHFRTIFVLHKYEYEDQLDPYRLAYLYWIRNVVASIRHRYGWCKSDGFRIEGGEAACRCDFDHPRTGFDRR